MFKWWLIKSSYRWKIGRSLCTFTENKCLHEFSFDYLPRAKRIHRQDQLTWAPDSRSRWGLAFLSYNQKCRSRGFGVKITHKNSPVRRKTYLWEKCIYSDDANRWASWSLRCNRGHPVLLHFPLYSAPIYASYERRKLWVKWVHKAA